MEIELNTIFRWCNDVVPMRYFYTDCLRLEETFFRDDADHGWLTYQIGPVQLVFMRAPAPLPVAAEFARNPGYRGGLLEAESWILKMERPSFTAIVKRLQASSYTLYAPEPEQPRTGALQFLALDPMGFTVEL
jgi:hypothetical protein